MKSNSLIRKKKTNGPKCATAPQSHFERSILSLLRKNKMGEIAKIGVGAVGPLERTVLSSNTSEALKYNAASAIYKIGSCFPQAVTDSVWNRINVILAAGRHEKEALDRLKDTHFDNE